jgi:hypothetical protein
MFVIILFGVVVGLMSISIANGIELIGGISPFIGILMATAKGLTMYAIFIAFILGLFWCTGKLFGRKNEERA